MANVFGLDTIDTLDVSTLYIGGVDIDNIFVKLTDDVNQNTSIQLQNYVTTTALNTTLTGYQRIINS